MFVIGSGKMEEKLTFKQKLPEAKPINESLKKEYFSDIVLIKSQLDSIVIKNKTSI